MKKSKFTDEQIAFALKQAEVGTPTEEVRRPWTLRATSPQAARRREQQAQAPASQPVARLGDVAGRARKKAPKPFRRRELVDHLISRYGASQRQARGAMKISRSVYGYRHQARDATPQLMRMKEITATRVHYGYQRVHVLLRQED